MVDKCLVASDSCPPQFLRVQRRSLHIVTTSNFQSVLRKMSKLLLLCVLPLVAATAVDEAPGGKLLAGYPTWSLCGEAVWKSVSEGVNMVIWFQMGLEANKEGKPVISSGLNLTCVAEMAGRMEKAGYSVEHRISVGGWDAAHPNASFSGKTWFHVFDEWNRNEVANASLGFPNGFSGFDWDLEGNDKKSSQCNHFTVEGLKVVSDMSVYAHKAGYRISAAPPQSYLDVATSEFSRSLLHPPVEPWYQNFTYHGRNAYAFLIADAGIDTFDFISIQLYESYSGAGYYMGVKRMSVKDYLARLVDQYTKGWFVDFESDPSVGLKSQVVSVPASKLVFGFGNGWTQPASPTTKGVYFPPEEVHESYNSLPADKRYRGFMFWCMAQEGEHGVVLSKELAWITKE